MKKFKMLLSIVMCLVMCFCMIPFGMLAQAETTMHTIWQADPYLAGKNVGETISFNNSNAGYTSKVSTTVGKDDEGYYYRVNATANEHSYVYTGVKSTVTSWIGNKAVRNAIQPYLEFSYDYRITTEASTTNNMEFVVWACGGWTPHFAQLSWKKLSLNSDWTTITSKVGTFGSSDGWSDGWIAFNPYGCKDYSNPYTIDIRNIKIQISSENATAINDALAAAGITDVTYDTLTDYEEFVYDPAMDDANSYTIWEAEAGTIGAEGTNVNVTTWDFTNTSNKYYTARETGRYYYSANFAGAGGWAAIKTGLNSNKAGMSWLADNNVLKAIAPYMQLSFEYRARTETPTGNIGLRVDAANAQTLNIMQLYSGTMTVDNEWHTIEKDISSWNSTKNWGESYLGISVFGAKTWPEEYSVDISNFKIKLAGKKKIEINKALAAAGITDVTFDTLVSFEEFVYDPSMDDTNSYMIWQAEAGVAGASGSVVNVKPWNFSPDYEWPPVSVELEENKSGYHYRAVFGSEGKWTFFKSGYNSSQEGLEWLSNSTVLKTIAPYAIFSYDYRVIAENAEDAKITLSLRAANDADAFKELGTPTLLTTDGEWSTVTKNISSWGDTHWGKNYVGITTNYGGSVFPEDGYIIDFKNINITLKGSDRIKINDALEAAGITDVTFESLTSFIPYEYINVDTPIWYANPDRSLADRNGDVDVTAEINDNSTIPTLGYSTVVYTDEDEGETFYRTIMGCQNGGSHSQNTYFTSGIAAENDGFGWMADANVITALKPYMYIGYEYRFQSAGNIPTNPTMYMQAANWGSLTTISTKKIIPGSWQVVEPKPLDSSAFSGTAFGSYDAKAWNDGEFMISIYGNGENFSGTQIIDIRNLRVSIPSQYRTKINEALSKVGGIDEIANFTLGVELGTDANGNKDYFSLLSTTEKAAQYDINDDDNFSLKDLIRMKKYEAYIINYMPEYIIQRADSNRDGYLDSVDLAEMRKALLAK